MAGDPRDWRLRSGDCLFLPVQLSTCGKPTAASPHQAGMGKVVVKTVAGGSLTASLEGGKVILTDEKGGKATVTATDLKGSNGVVHVIDTVLMPK